MEKMVADQQKLVDQNRKDDSDPDSEQSSDEENQKANQYTFNGAIDVGSKFIDVEPAQELKFV